MAMPSGGPRPNSGRPKGSKDSYPRGSRFIDTDRQRKAKQYATMAEVFLRTNGHAVFEGDSVELLVTIYKNENLPLYVRQSAAMAASSFERPRMSEARILWLEARAKEISDEELRRRADEGDARLDRLQEDFDLMTRERSQELQALIDGGGVSPAAAEAIRSWWWKPPGPAPLALPTPPSETPQDRRGSPPASKTPG
jgi:hypothetical protein